VNSTKTALYGKKLPSLPQWSTAFCCPSTAIAAIKFKPWVGERGHKLALVITSLDNLLICLTYSVTWDWWVVPGRIQRSLRRRECSCCRVYPALARQIWEPRETWHVAIMFQNYSTKCHDITESHIVHVIRNIRLFEYNLATFASFEKTVSMWEGLWVFW
jgi:hypothetical protein